jgi:CheY-like chemotaxis protein
MHHMLVVEDDDSIRQMMTEVLEEEGFSVSSAADGREALAYLHSAQPRPSLILLDLMMPEMDGWAFCAEQQRDPQLADIPVVVVSASNYIRQRPLPLGAVASLVKPFNLNELLDLVTCYCPV